MRTGRWGCRADLGFLPGRCRGVWVGTKIPSLGLRRHSQPKHAVLAIKEHHPKSLGAENGAVIITRPASAPRSVE